MPKCAVPKPSHPKAPPSPPPPPPPPAPAMDLKTLIHDHSLFFDRLVDLIPARFYVPAPDADERPWFHGLSNSAKASAKKQSRENIKKARRARYDPERTASTLDLLKNTIAADKKSTAAAEHEGNPNSSDAGSDREAEVEDPRPAAAAAAASVTYEELRRRLHRRIEELRGNRNTRALDGLRGKRRRDGEDGKKKKKEEEEEEFGDVAYGKVRVGGVEERGRKRKKLSMRQELGKAEKLEDAKKDAEKGKMVAEKHSWRAAMSRAVGEKVHDDPKVLRQSLRKERKRHQKHAEKWKERIEGQNKVREEKQKSRSENIRERIQQKKARRIEKREKKLMRPGFEGRKDGYINE